MILFAGFFLVPENLPGTPLCLFKYHFGFDCPGCGLTRAFLFIPRGEWVKAVQLNGASLVLYLVFVMMLIHQIFRTRFPDLFKHVWWCRLSGFFSCLTVVLLFGHWAIKTMNYFLGVLH